MAPPNFAIPSLRRPLQPLNARGNPSTTTTLSFTEDRPPIIHIPQLQTVIRTQVQRFLCALHPQRRLRTLQRRQQ